MSLVEQLPPLLRVYVGCAAVLYGDYRNADLVKIHIGSGKVSLMRYDDFEGKALPRMVERVKIKLREQDIDYFAYGEEYEPPFLYRKSRYINEEFPNYPEQVAFDEALEGLGLFDFSGYGPRPGELLADAGGQPLVDRRLRAGALRAAFPTWTTLADGISPSASSSSAARPRRAPACRTCPSGRRATTRCMTWRCRSSTR